MGELIGVATSLKDGLLPKQEYSKMNMVLYSGQYGTVGSGPKLYKLFRIGYNSKVFCLLSSGTDDKIAGVYSLTLKEIGLGQIKNINGVDEQERSRYFYHKDTDGYTSFYVLAVRDSKAIMFNYISTFGNVLFITEQMPSTDVSELTEIPIT